MGVPYCCDCYGQVSGKAAPAHTRKVVGQAVDQLVFRRIGLERPGVDFAAGEPGLQHLGFVQGLFVDLEHVAVQHDEVGLFAGAQRADLFVQANGAGGVEGVGICLLYTSPSPRDS